MISLRSFLTDSAKAYQFLQAIRILSSVLVGVLLVKFGIDKEQLATLEYVLFLVYVFAVFWSNGFNNSSLNFYPKLNLEEKKSFFSSVASVYIGFSFFSAALLLVFVLFGWIHLHNLTLLFVIYFLIQTPTLFLESQLLLKKQAKSILLLGFYYLLFPVSALIGYLLFKTNSGILFGLIAWASIRLISLLGFSFSSSKRIDFPLVRRFIGFSIPLMIYFVLGASAAFVDGFLIRNFFPTRFAEYRYGARELPLYTVLITSYLTAMIPLAVNQFEQTLHQVRDRLNWLMHILFPLAIILLFVSPYVFRLVYSAEYDFAAQIFNVYILILFPRLLAVQFLFFAKKENKLIMRVAIAEVALNVILSILLMKSFGIMGIMYATLIAYCFEKLIFLLIAKRKYNFQLGNLISINWYLSYSLLLLAAFVLSQVIVF